MVRVQFRSRRGSSRQSYRGTTHMRHRGGGAPPAAASVPAAASATNLLSPVDAVQGEVGVVVVKLPPLNATHIPKVSRSSSAHPEIPDSRNTETVNAIGSPTLAMGKATRLYRIQEQQGPAVGPARQGRRCPFARPPPPPPQRPRRRARLQGPPSGRPWPPPVLG